MQDEQNGKREARLRVEYGELYPTLPAGKWGPAAHVALRLLGECGTGEIEPGTRILSDEHFEFRGGSGRQRRSAPAVGERRADRERAAAPDRS